MKRPRVAVIGCGGTISSLSDDPLDTIDYPDSGTKLSAADVLRRLPELKKIADAVPIPFREVSSTALTLTDWFGLRDLIMQTARENPQLSGFVILHGTGTLEETAFFLHLTLDLSLPVIVTGAQRPLSAVGSDAPGNLVAALRVAATPEAQDRGVLIVMNDEIHSARDVVKTSTYRVQTFRSPDAGMLGQVDGDRVAFFRSITRRHTALSPFADLKSPGIVPRVDILYSYLGADAVFVDAALAAGARGLVSAGFPPGLVTPSMMTRFEDLAAEDFPVILCSRAVSGRVGDRKRTLAAKLLAGEDFSPQKARILLMLGLCEGMNIAKLRDVIRMI